MNLTEIIAYLFPYMGTIRRLKEYISIDLVFPGNWEFPQNIIEKCQVVQNENFKGQGISLSFVSKPTNELEDLIYVIEELINFNLEKQEKETLFKSKVAELKKLFNNSNLESLKHLEFNIYEITDEEDAYDTAGNDGDDISLG